MNQRDHRMSREDFNRCSESYVVFSLLFSLVLTLFIGWPALIAWLGTLWGMKLFRDKHTDR